MLLPFKQFVFYIPSPHPKSLSIEAFFERKSYDDDLEGEKTVYRLVSLQVRVQEIFNIDKEKTYYSLNLLGISEFTQILSTELCVPVNRIHFTSNVSIGELNDRISIPFSGITVNR